MKKLKCYTNDGEEFTIYQTSEGNYCCPVCGEDNFITAPYSEIGEASFDICKCGFQFGYDDSPLATKDAVEGVVANWKRWRRTLIEEAVKSRESLENLEATLRNINIELAFDLIDVDRTENN